MVVSKITSLRDSRRTSLIPTVIVNTLHFVEDLGAYCEAMLGMEHGEWALREGVTMGSATTTEENKRVVRRFPEEVATEGNIDVIDEICAEDVLDHSPLGDVEGREELKEQASYLLTAFGDFSATVEDIIGEGDTVAMRVTVRGTHEGEFMGVEPTGEAFEVQNMVFTRVKDGQIAERWVQPDMLGMLQQLGVVEPPEA